MSEEGKDVLTLSRESQQKQSRGSAFQGDNWREFHRGNSSKSTRTSWRSTDSVIMQQQADPCQPGTGEDED